MTWRSRWKISVFVAFSVTVIGAVVAVWRYAHSVHNLRHLISVEDRIGMQHYCSRGGNLDAGVAVYGSTPLMYALRENKRDAYDALLRLGANPNTYCRDGISVVHMAATKSDSYWLHAALESGGDPNLFYPAGVGSEKRPLPIAVIERRIENVKLLIDHGADLNSQDMYGRTPLVRAWQAAEFRIAYLLLERGADFNPKGPFEGSFIGEVRLTNPDDYPSVEERKWCNAALEWLAAHGADPQKATWDGVRWRFP